MGWQCFIEDAFIDLAIIAVYCYEVLEEMEVQIRRREWGEVYFIKEEDV